ncbi:MAG: hypothetical protein [Caudoviricetes sp.]|nr:MAG: hypothetical protein [Caudoviricetes sp.]
MGNVENTNANVPDAEPILTDKFFEEIFCEEFSKENIKKFVEEFNNSEDRIERYIVGYVKGQKGPPPFTMVIKGKLNEEKIELIKKNATEALGVPIDIDFKKWLEKEA